jgi:FkbM family methyltransferase
MNLKSVIKRFPLLHAAGRYWKEMRWLQRARRLQTYAQNGEDKAALELFPAGYRGTFVDLGANHPYRISNTYLFYTCGWRGLCVDPIPMFGPLYHRHRPADMFVNAGVGAEPGEFTFYEMNFTELSTFSREIAEDLECKGRATIVDRRQIKMRTVGDLVSMLSPDGHFDVLSIDIEGLDAEIVRNTDWRFVQPRVVICETSSYERDSGAEIVGLFAHRGYRHHRHVGCNDIFVNTAPGRHPSEVER